MRLNRLVPAALILFVSGPAFAQDWVEFTSQADFFTVNFPSEPKVRETTYRSEYGYDLPARVNAAFGLPVTHVVLERRPIAV